MRTTQTLEQTLVASADPDAFVDDYLVESGDARRSSDYFSKPHRLSDWPLYFDLGGVASSADGDPLFWMAAAFACVSLLIVLRSSRAAKTPRAAPRPAVIAISQGLDWATSRADSFIQRFAVLGHPFTRLSVVLLSFLLFSGPASMSSERLFPREDADSRRIIGALAVLLLVYNELLPYVFHCN